MSRGSPAGRTGATADADRLTTVFELLSHPRRRRTLYALRTADGPVPLEQLAERLLAGEEGGRDVRRKRLETALRHVHLSKLTDAGAVERDPDGAVRYAAGDWLDDWVARAAAAEGA